MTVTFAQVLQLYAPFVGLMALSFWMGVLSQRVRHLESFGYMKVSNQVVEIMTKMKGFDEKLDSLDRRTEGVQRQLANLSMGRQGQIYELPATGDLQK